MPSCDSARPLCTGYDISDPGAGSLAAAGAERLRGSDQLPCPQRLLLSPALQGLSCLRRRSRRRASLPTVPLLEPISRIGAGQLEPPPASQNRNAPLPHASARAMAVPNGSAEESRSAAFEKSMNQTSRVLEEPTSALVSESVDPDFLRRSSAPARSPPDPCRLGAPPGSRARPTGAPWAARAACLSLWPSRGRHRPARG
jgi:hypothetical protein